ncbi:MAG: HDOD domain-containing protein [Candidatus Thiodiazotropha sp. L084R]
MSQTVEEWVRQISAEPLPIMQRTLTQVRDLLNKKTSVNHSRLAEVISRDPGFGLYVMRQSSNPSKQPKEAITRISLAIPMLGMALIEKASKTLPCLEDKLKGPPRRGLIGCYSRAAHAACYARGLSEMRNQSDGDTLYTGALLHDIGEMAIWSEAPDTMIRIQKRIEAGEDRESVAQTELGFTFETLNIQLCQRWQLPDLISDAQSISNNFQPKPLTVMLASTLARETTLGWNSKKTVEDLEVLAEFLEIPQEQAISNLHRLAAETARNLQTLPLPLPAFFIICGDKKPVKKAQPETAQPTPAKKIPSEKKSIPAPPKATKPPPPKKSNPLQDMLSSALEQMHQELGLSRTMFAMLTPDRKMLRSRLVIESEQQLSLKDFALSTKNPSLFKLLLNKPQAISLNKNNAEKYLPMIPPDAREQINTSGFISMSIFIRNKPVGLFYADNGLSGPGVTRQQFENFKVICQTIMKTMSAS